MAQSKIKEPCLLCLDLRSDKLNCIRTDSKKWQDLNIANTVEKHFWPLNTIRFNSFICSQCWRLVDDFHKFYLRVEEAHTKFIEKMEKDNVDNLFLQGDGIIQNVEEIISDVSIKNEPLELNEDLESMSDMSSTQVTDGQRDSCAPKKPEILIGGMPRKRKRFGENLNDSESGSDCDDKSVVNSQSDISSSDNGEINEESDKFIIDFLKQINCHICKIQFDDFSALREHFLEAHQQKGYIFCCNRKYFRRKDLVDHIHYHLNPNYFKCEPCDKTFPGRMLLEKHKLRTHSWEANIRRHSCDVCGKLFFKLQSLKMHKLSHIPGSGKTLYKERTKFDMTAPAAEKYEYVFEQQDETVKLLENVDKRIDALQDKFDDFATIIQNQNKLIIEMLKENNSSIKNIGTINTTTTYTDMFPVKSVEQLQILEDSINESNRQEYISIIKIIVAPGGLIENFTNIFDMPIILLYNYDGTQNKKAFKELKYLNMVIFEATKHSGSNEKEYRNTIRNCFKVHKARHFRKLSYNRKMEKN